MAGLCWTPVVLGILLSAQYSFGAVDQSWLTNIVEGLKNEYELGDAFTLAVTIPQNQDPTGLKEVLQSDPVDKVKEAVSQGQVYQGTRVIAATQSDVLSRVLENIQSLATNSQGNVLVIYSEGAPNSSDSSIAEKINYVIQNWSAYAFVFSRVADSPTADTSQLAGSFKVLGISKLGLDNIFRCYKPENSFQCTSCSSGGDVTPSCVANSAPSDQGQGSGADAGADADADAGANAGADAGADAGANAGAGVDTGAGAGVDTGAGAGVATGTAVGVATGTAVGVATGTAVGAGAGLIGHNGPRGSKRGGGRRGGKRRKQVKRRGGGKRRKQVKRRGGGKRRKQAMRRGGGKRRKSGKSRRGGRRSKSGKSRGGGRRRKSGKSRRGGRRSKSGKSRGFGRRRKSGKRRGELLWEW